MHSISLKKAGDIKKVVVVGAGIMGEGIAQSFAQAGLSVKMVDNTGEILNRCLQQIEANLRQFQADGLLKEEPSIIASRIELVLSQNLTAAIQDSDFAVEAVPEILQLKRDLFSRMDSSRSDIILASNTSSFTISTIAEGLRHPGRVVGTHYFNPAHIIPLVEVHRGTHTDDGAVNITRELMLRTGKKPVLVKKELPGFVVNRIQGAIAREIGFLIDSGAVSPEDLDTAVRSSIGMRYLFWGPMELEDLAGLDTAFRIGKEVFKTLSNATEPPASLKKKVDSGELGVKSGKGWYDYTNRSRAQVLGERNKKLTLLLTFLKGMEK